MLQETPHDAAHADAAADAAQAGHQRALSANNQVNLNTRLRGAIQSANYRRIDDGVALGDDVRWAAPPRVARFPLNQRDTALGHVARGNEQRPVVRFFGIGSEVIEHVMYRSSDGFVACQQAQVGVKARGRGIVIPSAEMRIAANLPRSEERRVGKECRSRWSPYH